MRGRRFLWAIIIGILVFICAPVFSQIANNQVQKIFSLGRSLGQTYYHLIELNNKAKVLPYPDLKEEYQDAFLSLSITDLITDDLEVKGELAGLLSNIRFCLYNALNKQDLSESKVSAVLDMFMAYYEEVRKAVKEKYAYSGSWILDLSFYSAFQLESLTSDNKVKLLLSGLNNNTTGINITVPENIQLALNNIKALEKNELTTLELNALQENVTDVIEFFSGYPNKESIKAQRLDLVGDWQGFLLTPDCVKHDISLQVSMLDNSVPAVMSIDGIAQKIPISDIDVINDYFTFMFKPFGTNKLYIRFGAKLLDGVFAGEIVDVLGEKGYWVLAKVNDKNTIENGKLNTMNLYINSLETIIKNEDKTEITTNQSNEEKVTPVQNKLKLKKKIDVDESEPSTAN